MRCINPASEVVVGEGNRAEGVDVWEDGGFEVMVVC